LCGTDIEGRRRRISRFIGNSRYNRINTNGDGDGDGDGIDEYDGTDEYGEERRSIIR